MNERQDESGAVSLATLGQGGLEEMFAEEMRKVVRNILDPNTEATKVRAIVIKLVVKPNAERRIGDVEFSVAAKLEPVQKGHSTFYLARRKGEPVAVESDPRQAEMFDSKPDIRPAGDGERTAG